MLKRGYTKASVSLPSFSVDGRFLACSSEKTVHVFDISMGSNQTYIQGVIGYRAKCIISLPKKVESICGFSDDSTRLYIATSEGIFSKYSWDSNSNTFKFMSDCNLEEMKDDEASDAWI